MNPHATALYRSLIRARMKEHACAGCGESLESASVLWTEDGASFDDYGLSDESVAQVLAATEHLSVRCAGCGTIGDIGASRARTVPPPPVLPGRETPWDPHAAELYESLVRARLREQACSNCSVPLEFASVLRVAGGTALDDYGLSEDAVARLLAATQQLSVRCRQCGADLDV